MSCDIFTSWGMAFRKIIKFDCKISMVFLVKLFPLSSCRIVLKLNFGFKMTVTCTCTVLCKSWLEISDISGRCSHLTRQSNYVVQTSLKICFSQVSLSAQKSKWPKFFFGGGVGGYSPFPQPPLVHTPLLPKDNCESFRKNEIVCILRWGSFLIAMLILVQFWGLLVSKPGVWA